MNSENDLQDDFSDVYSYNLRSWMNDLHDSIKHLRLSELSLASAHNCGMDKEITQNDSYHACQDYPIRHQLDNGVRVLDIRLKFFSGKPGYTADKLLAFHGEGGRSLAYIMNSVEGFLQANSGEIVILDMHDISVDGNFTIPYQALYEYLHYWFGKYLLPATASQMTLEEIRKVYPGPRIVLSGPRELWWEGPSNPGRDRTYVWERVSHEWINQDSVTVEELKNFIQTSVMNNLPFNNTLWSTSATAFNLLEGPKDINQTLTQWYPIAGVWIRNSNIINFDWCARFYANMVQHCIQSNISKPVPERFEVVTPVNGATAFGPNLEVTGKGRPLATVQITGDGGSPAFGNTTVRSDGSWGVNTTITAGSYSFHCIQKLGGRASGWVGAIEGTLISTLAPPDIQYPQNGATVDYMAEIRGAGGVYPAMIRFYEANSNADPIGFTYVKSDGTWAGQPRQPIPPGPFSLQCDQVLNGFPSNKTPAVSFNVVPTRPVVEPPVNLRIISNGPKYVVVFAWEPGGAMEESYTFKVFGIEKNIGSETTYTWKALSEFPGIVEIRAVYRNGVKSQPAKIFVSPWA